MTLGIRFGHEHMHSPASFVLSENSHQEEDAPRTQTFADTFFSPDNSHSRKTYM